MPVKTSSPPLSKVRVAGYASSFFGAAMAFWVPDVLIHAIRGDNFAAVDVVVISSLLPLLTCSFMLLFLFRGPGQFAPVSSALMGLLGIWVTGPLMMSLGATFAGGGFSTSSGVLTAVLGTLLFPLFSFMMSTHDGSLLALLLVTIAVPVTGLARHLRSQRTADVEKPPG